MPRINAGSLWAVASNPLDARMLYRKPRSLLGAVFVDSRRRQVGNLTERLPVPLLGQTQEKRSLTSLSITVKLS